MSFILLIAPAAASSLGLEHAAEPGEVLLAWQAALRARGVEPRGTPALLMQGDHPALPFEARFTFSGPAVLGVRVLEIDGELVVRRVGAGQSAVQITVLPPTDPKDAAHVPRLLQRLADEAGALLAGAAPAPITADPVLADPLACAARVELLAASPIPGATEALILSLPDAAPACHRPMVRALVDTPRGHEAVSAWLLAEVEARGPAASLPLVPLLLMVPEPSDALLDALEAIEAAGD